MRVRLVIAAILAAASIVPAWKIARSSVGLDFYQFWAGGQIARSAENLYSAETRTSAARTYLNRGFDEKSETFLTVAHMRPVFEFFSTPFLYTTFGAFPYRYEPALTTYRILVFAAFLAGVLLFARATNVPWAAALLIAAFGFVLFQPLQSELRVLNVNSLQLAAIGLAMWLTRERIAWRGIAAGALLVIVTAFKPNVALVLPLLLVWRFISKDRARLQWESIGAAAGGAFAVIISSVYFRDFGAWLEWLDAARNLAASVLSVEEGNVAPFATAGAYSFAIMGVLAALTAAALWIRRNSASADLAPLVAGLALLVHLISASLVWLHYLILALPSAIALIGDRTSKTRQALGILGLTLTGFDLWMHLFNIRSLQTQSRLFWLGLAVLFVASLWRLWDIRTAAPVPASTETDDRRRTRTGTRTPRTVR
jgi:Glycosyltransferase family 87